MIGLYLQCPFYGSTAAGVTVSVHDGSRVPQTTRRCIISKLLTLASVLWRIVKRSEDAEYCRFLLSEKITETIYPKYKFSEFGRVFLHDKKFVAYHDRYVGSKNYRSYDRKYTLDQLMGLVLDVEGDTAECGAYRGASSYLVCRSIRGCGKTHHVFDSFAGLPVPSSEDGPYWKEGDMACSEGAIRHNLKEFDYVSYHVGWIPDRFHEVANCSFAFVHIDVDLYRPTLDSLVFFYERMSSGGVILCDDYGFESCPGAQRAMDGFFLGKKERIIGLTTGQGLVIKR